MLGLGLTLISTQATKQLNEARRGTPVALVWHFQCPPALVGISLAESTTMRTGLAPLELGVYMAEVSSD